MCPDPNQVGLAGHTNPAQAFGRSGRLAASETVDSRVDLSNSKAGAHGTNLIRGTGLAAHDIDERLHFGAARLPAFQDIVGDGSNNRAPFLSSQSIE